MFIKLGDDYISVDKIISAENVSEDKMKKIYKLYCTHDNHYHVPEKYTFDLIRVLDKLRP